MRIWSSSKFINFLSPIYRSLLGAVLEPDPDLKPVLTAEDRVEESPPEIGCSFQSRCPRVLGKKCSQKLHAKFQKMKCH